MSKTFEELIEIKERKQWEMADVFAYDPFRAPKYRWFSFSGRAKDLVEALKTV